MNEGPVCPFRVSAPSLSPLMELVLCRPVWASKATFLPPASLCCEVAHLAGGHETPAGSRHGVAAALKAGAQEEVSGFRVPHVLEHGQALRTHRDFWGHRSSLQAGQLCRA